MAAQALYKSEWSQSDSRSFCLIRPRLFDIKYRLPNYATMFVDRFVLNFVTITAIIIRIPECSTNKSGNSKPSAGHSEYSLCELTDAKER